MISRTGAIKIFKGILLGLTLLLLWLLISPGVKYLLAEPSTLSAELLQNKSQKTASYSWLQKHYKWQKPEKESNPHLVWIDDSTLLNPDFETRLGDNILAGEYLFTTEGITSEQQDQVAYLFDLNFSGRIGKACSDLADPGEVAMAVRTLYEKNSGNRWEFRGKGLLIFSDSDVLVLKEGTDYQGDFYWTDGQLKRPFRGYFEIVTTNQKVTSRFETDMSPLGLKKLESLGISPDFPASIETAHPLFKAYYFTTAFKNTPINVPYFYQGVEKLMANKGLYDRTTSEEIYWKWYLPLVENISAKALAMGQKNTATGSAANSHAAAVSASLQSPLFKTAGQTILRRSENGRYEPFYIKGVNLGAALPGKTFTEFPRDAATYRLWLNQMGQLHINTLRVYTLLPPAFYKALYDYNQSAEAPIYLLQEIWPEENPPQHDYLAEAYNTTYHQEINYVVNAVHGNATIPKRSYRAYGAYAYDVSPYLIGYLVGRELEPDEVLATDALNAGYHFQGKYLYGEPGASPTENWLAAACDYALETEINAYGTAGLVAIVNWPTLDPLNHFSEWNPEGDKTKQYNDKAVVDINQIGIASKEVPGFFGAYHIYPNYPDFMNNDPEYSSYQDELGSFRYGAYLKAFMAQHVKYPALVAEYGISTSMVTAHVAPNGNNHGGLSEQVQGPELIRMAKAIEREGYAGGLIFEWMDEWAKKTWTTEPYMIPYNRHALWHNVMDPEQNYGLMAMASPPAKMINYYTSSTEPIRQIQVGTSASYVSLAFEFADEAAALQSTEVLIDTHNPVGEPQTWEFKLSLAPAGSELLVNPGYNWTKNRFQSKEVPPAQFETMTFQTNAEGLLQDGTKIPSISISLSQLKTGSFDISQNQVQRRDNWIYVRLPYTLLGISDPSSAQVLSDPGVFVPTGQDQIKTLTSQALKFAVYRQDQPEIGLSHPLTTWDEADYYSRPKLSFELLRDYFKTLP